jgi:hypothetical protein
MASFLSFAEALDRQDHGLILPTKILSSAKISVKIRKF